MSCVEKDKWLVAAHKELHRHLVNGTWRVMSRTKSKKKPLTLRWVFKVKHDGTYKARLFARGFVKIPTADMAADGLTKPLAKRYSSAGSSKWASRSIKTR
ncbi:hypothetical protein PDIDSM_3377 [Penicillium digitatum]|nr:hypothetical protein PDIDSM_3377 [Penicillium digitatum]